MQSSLIVRNIRIGSHRTSSRMEDEFWAALEIMVHEMRRPMEDVLADICLGDDEREGTATSAIKTAALLYFMEKAGYDRDKITETGQRLRERRIEESERKRIAARLRSTRSPSGRFETTDRKRKGSFAGSDRVT